MADTQPAPAGPPADPEQRLDAFIIWLSRQTPLQRLPSRERCRVLLAEADVESARKGEVPPPEPAGEQSGGNK